MTQYNTVPEAEMITDLMCMDISLHIIFDSLQAPQACSFFECILTEDCCLVELLHQLKVHLHQACQIVRYPIHWR